MDENTNSQLLAVVDLPEVVHVDGLIATLHVEEARDADLDLFNLALEENQVLADINLARLSYIIILMFVYFTFYLILKQYEM